MKVIAAITFINHNTKSNDINFESNNDLKIILSSVYISEINFSEKKTNLEIYSLKQKKNQAFIQPDYDFISTHI